MKSSQNNNNGNQKNQRNIVLIALVLGALFFVFNTLEMKSLAIVELSYNELKSGLEKKELANVSINGNEISGTEVDGKRFVAYATEGELPHYTQLLRDNEIDFKVNPSKKEEGGILSVLISWLPAFIIFGLFVFFFRQMMQQSGGGKVMGFGKSKAKLMNEFAGRVLFRDVAGIEEAKDDLKEVVDFLKSPGKFERLGGRVPKGVLLSGLPGTGKTLLARAVAGEAGVAFFSISGSDFVEMFVGVGASRVRDMFEQGKKNAPCIIFIDEIDAVGRQRGSGYGGGNDEREQTLNQMLVEMDGFEPTDNVIIIAATNRPDVLDKALLRPGRFDRHINIPLPDILGRQEIIKVHIEKVRMGDDVDIHVLARGTPGFSGADLENLINEGALLAARRNLSVITMEEFEAAKDKILMGAERRSMVVKEDERRLTAYHEGGHALVSLNCTNYDPIHKATIMPRGRALGLVQNLPKEDRLSYKRCYIEDFLAVAMGGRVAEEIVFGVENITTGASQDIKVATDRARRMVLEWGMSEKVGPVYYGEDETALAYGRSSLGAMSEKFSELLDEEVKKIVEKGYLRAKEIIVSQRDKLELIAKALLDYETLTGEELNELLLQGKIARAPHESPKDKEWKESLKNTSPLSGEDLPGKDADSGKEKKEKKLVVTLFEETQVEPLPSDRNMIGNVLEKKKISKKRNSQSIVLEKVPSVSEEGQASEKPFKEVDQKKFDNLSEDEKDGK